MRRWLTEMGIWSGIASATLLACGPQAGTESGNPINPPNPPSEVADGPSFGVDDVPDPIEGVGGETPPDVAETGSPFEDVGMSDPDPATAVDPVPDAAEPQPSASGPGAIAGVPEPPPDASGEVPSASPDVDGAMAPNQAEPTAPQATPGEAPVPASEEPQAGADPTAPAPGASGGFDAGDAATSCDPSACEAIASAAAASLVETVQSGGGYDDADCQLTQTGSICACSGSSGIVTVATDTPIACVVQGRFGCLYESSEFMGCEPAGEQCGLVCDEIFARQAADDARSVLVEVRMSACLDDGSCGYVLASEQECWVGGPSLSEVDCSLTDEEILGLAAPVE